MFRYNNFSNIGILTDLHNGYSIIGLALWNKDTETYKVNFYIKDNQTDHFDLMEKYSSVMLESDSLNIRNVMNEYINENYNAGSFDYYIQRTNYELRCFDYGADFLGETNE